MDTEAAEITQRIKDLRKELRINPKERHPSDWVELGQPVEWALRYFNNLPRGVLVWASSEERSDLIPPRFGENPSVLERAYFNDVNLEYVHDSILAEIEKSYGYSLGRQSDVQLILLMTRTYDDHSGRFPDVTYREQGPLLRAIRTLNAFCVEAAVKSMVREIRDFITDRKYWEQPLVPELALPEFTSKRNEAPLDSQPFFVEEASDLRLKPAKLSEIGVWPGKLF